MLIQRGGIIREINEADAPTWLAKGYVVMDEAKKPPGKSGKKADTKSAVQAEQEQPEEQPHKE